MQSDGLLDDYELWSHGVRIFAEEQVGVKRLVTRPQWQIDNSSRLEELSRKRLRAYEAFANGGPRDVYKSEKVDNKEPHVVYAGQRELKEVLFNRRRRPNKLRDAKGQLLVTKADRMQRWYEYFKDLLNVHGTCKDSNFDFLPVLSAIGDLPSFAETIVGKWNGSRKEGLKQGCPASRMDHVAKELGPPACPEAEAAMRLLLPSSVAVEAVQHGDPQDGKPWPVVVLFRNSETAQNTRDVWLQNALRPLLGKDKDLGLRPARYPRLMSVVMVPDVECDEDNRVGSRLAMSLAKPNLHLTEGVAVVMNEATQVAWRRAELAAFNNKMQSAAADGLLDDYELWFHGVRIFAEEQADRMQRWYEYFKDLLNVHGTCKDSNFDFLIIPCLWSLDLVTAYDSVVRSGLWKDLYKYSSYEPCDRAELGYADDL
ncbi:unnamed protein product, partial [Symbiodinium natans]